jgi:alpha-L-fucosidase
MALIHFNMATFFHNGDPGCDASNWKESQQPASFAPDALNVSQWIVSMKALGVKEAVLTAKHGCGFLLWNTSTTLPGGKPYAYHAPTHLDVLQQFTDSMQAAGLGCSPRFLGNKLE